MTAVTTPAHGTAVIATAGGVTYTPAAGYSGSDQFDYTLSDGNGGSATGTVMVGVGLDTDSDGLIDSTRPWRRHRPEQAGHGQRQDPRRARGRRVTHTDPLDDDSDDDGLLDGNEDTNKNGVVDADETDPLKVDTDSDALQDGTEPGSTSRRARTPRSPSSSPTRTRRRRPTRARPTPTAAA